MSAAVLSGSGTVTRKIEQRRGKDSRSTINNNRPIHQLCRQIVSPHAWKAQNRHHHQNKRTRTTSNWLAEFTQMPWSTSETISHKEHPNEDRDRESYHGCDSSNGEDSTDCYFTAKDEEKEQDANESVEPDCVDGRISVLIYLLDHVRERKAIITRISESDSRRSNHASLTHKEPADDGDG